jgi:serine/threonine kinase PknH
VIATGMAKDPDNRYATTVELAHAARDAITVPVARPAPSPAPEPPAAPAARPATAPTHRDYKPPQLPPSAFAPAPTQHRPSQPPTWPPQRGPAPMEERRTGPMVPPPTPPPISGKVPPVQRLSRRTKVVLGAVALAVVVTIVVATMVFGGNSSTGGRTLSSISSSSSVGTTTSTRTPTTTLGMNSPAAVEKLQSEVPSDLQCKHPSSWGTGGSIADVDCSSGSGLTHLVYSLFADRTSLDREFETVSSSFTLVNCPGKGPSPQPWSRAGNPPLDGRVKCQLGGVAASGAVMVVWTVESQLVYGWADGTGNAAFQWWAAHYQ